MVEATLSSARRWGVHERGRGADGGAAARALLRAAGDRLQLSLNRTRGKGRPPGHLRDARTLAGSRCCRPTSADFIFLRAARLKEKAKPLSRKYWAPFDMLPADAADPDGMRFWKVEERQGRIRRPRVNLFMQHFLSLEQSAEINPGVFYRTYRDWIRTAKALRERRGRARGPHASRGTLRQFLMPNTKTRAGLFASRLRDLDTTDVYPLLLGLMVDNRIASGALDGIVVDLESFLVRRIVRAHNELQPPIPANRVGTERRGDGLWSGRPGRVPEGAPRQDRRGRRLARRQDEFESVWLHQPPPDRLGSAKLEMVLIRHRGRPGAEDAKGRKRGIRRRARDRARDAAVLGGVPPAPGGARCREARRRAATWRCTRSATSRCSRRSSIPPSTNGPSGTRTRNGVCSRPAINSYFQSVEHLDGPQSPQRDYSRRSGEGVAASIVNMTGAATLCFANTSARSTKPRSSPSLMTSVW